MTQIAKPKDHFHHRPLKSKAGWIRYDERVMIKHTWYIDADVWRQFAGESNYGLMKPHTSVGLKLVRREL
jgi:hypothetical protein